MRIDRVKVLCGSCGAALAKIVDTDPGVVFHWRHGDSDSAVVVQCPDHGWVDMNVDAVVAALTRARSTGRVVTYRGRASPARPDPRPGKLC